MKPVKLHTPLDEKKLATLKAGTPVLLSGILYVARDLAHKRLVTLLEKNKPLPMDLKGHIIFYAGPTPVKPGEVTGSIGPTTSYRMDPYTEPLLRQGLKGVMGKGERSPAVYAALKKYKALYFITVGGIAALLAKRVVHSRIIAYQDLGAEAIRELKVRDFPAIVASDLTGRHIFPIKP